jgi:bifunctional enzyme CysN/CysC
MTRTHLKRLEAESIQLFRDAVAATDRTVVAVGRREGDSALLLHLARKAFYPAEPPFPRVSFQAPKPGDPAAPPLFWRVTPVRAIDGEPVRIAPLARWTEADVQEYGQHEGLSLGVPAAERAAPARSLRVVAGGAAGPGKRALIASLPELAIEDPRDDDPRALVAAATAADAAVIVVEAGTTLDATARRHIVLAALLGVRHVALVVSTADLGGAAPTAFAGVETEFRKLAAAVGLSAVSAVPISPAGDNVRQRSAATPWYTGPTVLELLDGVEREAGRLPEPPLRLPVQWVNRVADFRGYAGMVVAGRVRPGDSVRVQPSGRISRVERIVSHDGDCEEAAPGESVTLVLADQVDAGRGDLIVAADAPAEVADQFEATVIWLGAAPMLRGRGYRLQLGTQLATATVSPLKYKLDPTTFARMAGPTLGPNEIGVCNLQLDRAVAFDPYRVSRDMGGFVLIDRLSGDTVGVGTLHFALRRAQNVHWQALDVNKRARAESKGQRPCVLWYTGLSGAGKSTIANLVDKKLHSTGRHTYLLDGDNVRHGLNKDLGFTDADRVENIRRIAEVAKLMVDAGLIVSTAFISPFRAERQMARSLMGDGEFIEVHVHTPIGVAEQRDPKGLYKKARKGDLKNFTGIDSPYEAPENPELKIDTTNSSPEESAETIVTFLQARGIFAAD